PPVLSTPSLHDALPISGGILLIRLAHPLLLQRPRVAHDRAGSRHGRTQRAAESPRSGSAPPSRGGPARQRALPGEYGSVRESVGDRKSTRLNSSHVSIS